MREHKYRCWDTYNKKWLDPEKLNIRLHDGGIQANGSMGIIGGVEVVEFTGLLDKNGTEIYGGDIMRIGMSDFISPGVYKVEYFCGGFRLMRESWDETITHHLGDMPNGNNEIIGNIYSNPELLDD